MTTTRAYYYDDADANIFTGALSSSTTLDTDHTKIVLYGEVSLFLWVPARCIVFPLTHCSTFLCTVLVFYSVRSLSTML